MWPIDQLYIELGNEQFRSQHSIVDSWHPSEQETNPNSICLILKTNDNIEFRIWFLWGRMQWKFKHWTVHAQNLERKGNESTLFIRTVLHQNKSLFICTKGQMLFWNPFLLLKGVSSKPSGNMIVAPFFCFWVRNFKFWLLAYFFFFCAKFQKD